MKVTVFTSNQPRHLSLVESLASISTQVFAVHECNTVFPGQIEDFFRRSNVMQEYFGRVIEAENLVFGRPRFSGPNVRSLSIKSGDLNLLEMSALAPALESDFYIVFGSSYIKGPLIEFLVSQKALNIHMGVSPYYRGNSCNFWALYDGHPQYLGATIHLLSKGLDSGPMLFHALPAVEETDPFVLGMRAVKSAHAGLVAALSSGRIAAMTAVHQDRSLEIRYTRKQDFSDDVASDYLSRAPSPEDVHKALEGRDLSLFLRPYIPGGQALTKMSSENG